MNLWIIASGLLAALCTAGHAVAGHKMYFRSIQLRLTDPTQSGVFSGMWHLITLHFAFSSLILLLYGAQGRPEMVVYLVAAQFGGYAVIYLILSLRLGGVGKLFQWMPFAGVGLLAVIGGMSS